MSGKRQPSEWPLSEDEIGLSQVDRRKGYLNMRTDRELALTPVIQGNHNREQPFLPHTMNSGAIGLVKGYREYLMEIPLNETKQSQTPSMQGTMIIKASGQDDENNGPDGSIEISSPPNLMSSSADQKRDYITETEQDEKFKATESGERLVVPADYVEAATQARDEARSSLARENEPIVESVPIPPSAGKIAVCTPVISTPLSYQEGVVELEVLQRMSELLSQNTLEAHKEALKVLRDSGLLAVQRWEDIHTSSDLKHNLSKVSKKRVNTFAEIVLKHLNLNSDSVILELGSGYGNDALWFARHSEAHIIGVDSSQAAVTEALNNIRSRKMTDRINLTCHDFFKVLGQSKGLNLDVVYSHSTLHYSPPLILQMETFPLIADVLRANNEGERSGKLCMAMKIAASASAASLNQFRLLKDDPYNASVDLRDKVFRIYPENKEAIVNLLAPSFDIEYARIVPVKGYDRNGEIEYFCYIIATPKKQVAPSPSPSAVGSKTTTQIRKAA